MEDLEWTEGKFYETTCIILTNQFPEYMGML